MGIDPSAVGNRSEPAERSWTSRDALLYAVAVGAGQDPLDAAELPFVTENSNGVDQQVLPTFAVVLPEVTGAFAHVGSFNPVMLVHGEERVVWHRPIPVAGTLSSVGEVTAIWDKGSGAVIEVTGRAELVAVGGEPVAPEPLFDVVMSVFIRGEGGFGGERGPSGSPNAAPDRDPDHRVALTTRPEQALLYRLTGDRNPLHSDPTFATLAGFDRPILHGLCTYGFTGRALLHALAGGDPARLSAMAGRFSAPVFPGEELTVEVWRTGDGEAVFRTLGADGRTVIDAGACSCT